MSEAWGHRWLLLALAMSFSVHALAILLARSEEPAAGPLQRPVDLVMVEVEPPKPPPPPPPEVRPEPPKPKVRPEPPPEEAPPPPNEEAAEEPPKPVPLVVGVALSSTTAAGSFAAPVGNTAYGKTADTAAAPEEVKPYKAPNYAPVHQVDSEPEPLEQVWVEFPEEARLAGIEGRVILSILIDDKGNVVRVKVVTGPGYGLNEAAVEAVKRFKWKPAQKGGQPVSTEIKYTYAFVLD